MKELFKDIWEGDKWAVFMVLSMIFILICVPFVLKKESTRHLEYKTSWYEQCRIDGYDETKCCYMWSEIND